MVTRLLTLLVCLLSGCAASKPVPAEPGRPIDIARLQGIVEQWENDGKSGVVRLTRRGFLLFQSGFGSAACDANEPVSPEHVFMIGSITKDLTQLLAFVLEERGVFSLEDTVASLVSEISGPVGEVTLMQLLRHTGGLPDVIDANGNAVNYNVEYDYVPVSRDELLARASLIELLEVPDDEEVYSNLGYQLLAAIFEIRTGKTYAELLRQYIYVPAGMQQTDFWFGDAEEMLFADGCLPDDVRWGNPIDDDMWGPAGPSWNLQGAGGLLSTAASLGRFFDGIGNDVYFDSPEQARRYREERLVYANSWQQFVMAPAGSNGIFNAVGLWADGDALALVLMTNRADHMAEDGMFREVLGVLQPPPPDSTSTNEE